jgi:ubiquinone/menaquinone biosynthesis C-methylase UbiE
MKTEGYQGNTSEQLLSNYQDYYADGDSEWRRLSALDKANNIITLCKDIPHQSVLEIGAGEGSILKRLSGLNFGDQLFAVEISHSGVEAIKNKKIPRLEECELFDGYQLPYEDNRFDVAILSHVVEHVEHPRLLIYEAARVARNVFIEVPLEDTMMMAENFVFNKVGHINFYSPKSIRRLVQTCNLKVVGQITTNPSKEVYQFKKGFRGFVNFLIKNIVLKLAPGMATKIFTYHSALLCRK